MGKWKGKRKIEKEGKGEKERRRVEEWDKCGYERGRVEYSEYRKKT